MPAFEAVVGPVDRLRGITLPDELNLNAVVLMKPPGPDGVHYKETDVISEAATAISFAVDSYRLLSLTAITITLKAGSWPAAYLLLLDDSGEAYGVGAVRSADGAVISGSLEAGKNRISVENHRRA